MISWLIIALLAYLFFSLAFFGDKLMLAGRQNAKLYTFYVGGLSLLAVFLVPFAHLVVPTPLAVVWMVLTAATSLLGIYSMFVALEKFEVSKVMPTIGGLQPLFILVLTWLFWGFQHISGWQYVALVLLVLGSITISLEKKLSLTRQYLKWTVFSSLAFSLNYVFSKLVFESVPFLEGLIGILGFTLLFVLPMLFDRSLRHEVFAKKGTFNKKTGMIFLLTQSSGGLANFLQSWAISLAPVSLLAMVNALRGVQYVFLLIITLGVSWFLPKFFKEEISTKIIFQKVISMVLIGLGLAIIVVS